MLTCQALPAGAGFVSSMTVYVDCQAQSLGSGAWQAFAAPGSTLSIVLTGFLTITVALIGYNLLLGYGLTVRSGTLAFVKIGAVLALATSWPAYRTLVYDLVIVGPGQLVSEIGSHAGVAGSDGTLLQRLDLTDQALGQLALLGPGNVAAGQAQAPPPPWAGFNAFALGGSRILFLLTAIAGIGGARIVTGLMLALGPFFIAFLMFDSTRSLFEGWVRALAGSALATFGMLILLGLQLAVMEPWVSDVLARRMAGEALPNVPTELFVLTMLFTIVAVVAIAGCSRAARSFRLAFVMQSLLVLQRPPVSRRHARSHDPESNSAAAETARSRAAALANVLLATNRRDESHAGLESRRAPMFDGRSGAADRAGIDRAPTATPIGRSLAPRSASRVSARAKRRDAAA